MSGYIRTMKDLESSSYGLTGGAAGNAVLKSAGLVGGFGTAHDAGTSLATGATGTADLYNVLYGQKVWSMLNQEVNALSMIAKRPYTSSGWRVLKSRPQGGSGSSFAVGSDAMGGAAPAANLIGGVVENATLGDPGFLALAPEYDKLFVSPKTVAHLFEFSELGMELAAIDDGVGDIRAIIREDMGKHHAESQNKMLLMPFETYGADAGDTSTPDLDLSKNYTSLLKIVSSSDEIAAMAAADMIGGGTTESAMGEEMRNIFGKDRNTAGNGYLDAVVNFGSSYAAGDARLLTLSLLNSVIREVRENGGNTKVMLTGYDTVQAIGDLLQSQERFMDRREIVPTHNGVRGVSGAEVGFRVATYYDIPIIPCKDMTKTSDTNVSNKLSDILLLDTDHLWLSVMKPTQYFEDGITNGNPFGVGKLGNQGMYRTIGETCCSFFKGQGKITNLKSA